MPSGSSTRGRLAPTAALAVLALLGACSKDRSSLGRADEASLVRLVPVVSGGGAAVDEEPVFVARLGVEDALERWRFEGQDRVELEADPGRPPMLAFDGNEPLHVHVPVPSGLRDFNRVDVELQVARYGNLLVDWVAGVDQGRSIVSVPLLAEIEPQVVEVELPYRTTVQGAPDELHVVIGGRGAARLGALTLYAEPWAARLPDPARGADHVRVGGESRLAWGLASGHPLELALGEVRAPELAFDFALPGTLRLPDGRPELQLTLLEGEEAVHEELWPLPTDARPEPYWRSAWVDLRPFAGRALRARFEVVKDGGREAFCALGVPALVARARSAPTTLLITSDTHRADHVDASGLGVDVRTPALDALIARGTYFENCFTSTNVTNPSHVALMTGTHPRDTRVVDNQTLLVREATTLAERFREAGYLTFACVSAAHLEDRLSGLGQGFDRVSAPTTPERDGRETIDRLFEWLADADGLPTFVWLHVFDAHTPYIVPEPFERMYYPADRDPTSKDVEDALERSLRPSWARKVRDPEYVRAQYKAEVSYLDGLLAEVFAHERLKDANVVFTADHGESLGQHHVYWDHAGLYPDSVHVPMIVAGPRVPRGVRVGAPVEQIDAGRTLLDLAGLARAGFPGDNLLATAEEDDRAPREDRFALAAYGHEASINRGPWLLVLHLHPHGYGPAGDQVFRPQHSTELYRLDRDPGCVDDLVEREPAVARELRAALVEWLSAARDLGWARRTAGDADTREKLAALGYTDEAPEVEGDRPWIDPECGCRFCARFR